MTASQGACVAWGLSNPQTDTEACTGTCECTETVTTFVEPHGTCAGLGQTSNGECRDSQGKGHSDDISVLILMPVSLLLHHWGQTQERDH